MFYRPADPPRISELKALATSEKVKERRPYARLREEKQLIRTRLRPPHDGEKITLMNAASIAQFINGGVVGRGLCSRKVSLVMVRLGFKSVHTKAGNFFEVYQIPANEIQPTLAYVDETEADTSSLPTMTEGDLPF
jgi:hypothetical protein